MSADIFSDDDQTTPRFSVGDKVWTYRKGLYPMEGEILAVKHLGLSKQYQVKVSATLSNESGFAEWEIFPRPDGRADLLKEIDDEIEFLGNCRDELVASA